MSRRQQQLLPSTSFEPPPSVVNTLRSRTSQRRALDGLKARLDHVSRGSSTGTTPSQVAYNECQALLDEIIRTCPKISGSLQWVKKSYDMCIEVTSDGWKGNVMAARNAHQAASHDESLRRLQLREEELKERIAKVEAGNARLQGDLDNLRQDLEANRQHYRALGRLEEQRVQHHGVGGRERQDMLVRTGLTMEESVDVDRLHSVLAKLESDIADLKKENKRHYLPKEKGRALDEEMDRIEVTRRRPLSEEEKLASRHSAVLETAIQAATVYHSNPGLQQMCSIKSYVEQQVQLVSSTSGFQSHDKDGGKTSEGDELSRHHMYLQSMDRLVNLIEDERYFDAAVLAACKCQFLLRVPKTMEVFQEAKPSTAVPDPMMLYCDTLMSIEGVPMDNQESVCCAKYLLGKGDLQRIEQWYTVKKLTPSRELGQLVFEFAKTELKMQSKKKCWKLAETIFMQSGSQLQGLYCMLKQGGVHRMVRAARVVNINRSDLMNLLRAEPSVELSFLVLNEESSPCTPPLTVAEVLTSTVLGKDSKTTLIVAKSIFGTAYERLMDFMMPDKSTAWSEWMKLAEECHQLPELAELGLEVMSGCVAKFGIDFAVEHEQRRRRSASLRQ